MSGDWVKTSGGWVKREPIPEDQLGKWAAPREGDFPGIHQPDQDIPDPGAGGDERALQRAQARGSLLETLRRPEPAPATEAEGEAARAWMAREAGYDTWEQLANQPLWIPSGEKLPPVRDADLLADWATPREDDYGGGPVAWDIDVPQQDQNEPQAEI